MYLYNVESVVIIYSRSDMKIFIIMLALVFSASLTAQENMPTYEDLGDMVKATYYHDNGEVAQVGFYLDEKLHDKWEMFNEEGKKIAMGHYHMGKRTGKWFFWNQEGLKEVDFVDNKVVNVVKHNSAESIVIN